MIDFSNFKGVMGGFNAAKCHLCLCRQFMDGCGPHSDPRGDGGSWCQRPRPHQPRDFIDDHARENAQIPVVRQATQNRGLRLANTDLQRVSILNPPHRVVRNAVGEIICGIGGKAGQG